MGLSGALGVGGRGEEKPFLIFRVAPVTTTKRFAPFSPILVNAPRDASGTRAFRVNVKDVKVGDRVAVEAIIFDVVMVPMEGLDFESHTFPFAMRWLQASR